MRGDEDVGGLLRDFDFGESNAAPKRERLRGSLGEGAAVAKDPRAERERRVMEALARARSRSAEIDRRAREWQAVEDAKDQLKPATPTIRQRVSNAIQVALEAAGVPRGMARHYGNGLTGLGETLSLVGGGITAAEDFSRAARGGRWDDASLSGAALAASVLPFGRMGRQVVKEGRAGVKVGAELGGTVWARPRSASMQALERKAQAAADAVKSADFLPAKKGDRYAQRPSISPSDERGAGPSPDHSQWVGNDENLASRFLRELPHPEKPVRPFSADYPAGARTDSAGRLVTDIGGRPLVAKHVAGRRVKNGDDVGLTSTELDSVTEGLTGSPVKMVSDADLRDAAGRYRYSGQGGSIDLRRTLVPETRHQVHAHELGHAIDHLLGWLELRNPARAAGVNLSDVRRELEYIYNDMNNRWLIRHRTQGRNVEGSKWPGHHGVTPESLGYEAGHKSDRELAAEGLRAYLLSPNYMKTVAPKAAAYLRAVVNSNPRTMRVLQLNSLAGLALLGGWASGVPAQGEGDQKS